VYAVLEGDDAGLRTDEGNDGPGREFDTDAAIDRAVETFWQRGYDGTGMQDLCESMDLHSGSIYAAFRDKRTLFLAAMDRYIETVSREAI
jgi:TetR/AcrR family transcriptional repressor of nem operon